MSIPGTAPLLSPQFAQFAWANTGSGLSSYTLTVLRGVAPADALRLVAGRTAIAVGPARPVVRQVARANRGRRAEDAIRVAAAARRGGFTLVFEDNGFRAADRRVTQRLSTHGVATVFSRRSAAAYRFVLSRGGRVVRDVDPLRGSSRAGGPLPEEGGLPFGDARYRGHINQITLELIRRLTGYAVSPTDLVPATYQLAAGVRG